MHKTVGELMAEQRINLVISGREYPLEAESPEMERLMRLAAGDVNRMLEKFNEQFPTTPFEDKLVFVAIREAAGKLLSQGKLQGLVDEADSLKQDLAAYLDGEEK